MPRQVSELESDDEAAVDVDEAAVDVAFVDHEAMQKTVRFHRARRKARIEHRKRGRRAAIRFWVVLLALLVAIVALSMTVWHEIQRLFGL